MRDWHSPVVRRAVEGSVISATRLGLWDDGIALALQFVEKTKGTLEVATLGQAHSICLKELRQFRGGQGVFEVAESA